HSVTPPDTHGRPPHAPPSTQPHPSSPPRPAPDLAPLTTYTATISTGATDLAGNPLTTDMSWSFTTGVAPDTTAPVLAATGPANADPKITRINSSHGSISYPMFPSTINTSTLTVMQ